MKAQLWVESHQPVALVPLSMLKIEPGDVVYIGEHYEKPEKSWYATNVPELNGPTGWFQAGRNGIYVSLDTANYFFDNYTDYQRSQGRRLQDGESILVRYTNR
jgi:hypothetical protein